MMKIIAGSHLDHGLSSAHVAWLLDLTKEWAEFHLVTLDLPTELEPLDCGLYGPSMGDLPVEDVECEMICRGNRDGLSRMVDRPSRKTRKITVIAGPDGDEPCVLYTSYGGIPAPREPWDPSLNPEQKVEGEAFWAQHALAKEV